jgi:hypothetical protein
MKSKKVAYFLLVFLGFFGIHKFYLRRPVIGCLYLVTFGLCGIGWLYDLFTLGRQVDDFNGVPLPPHKLQQPENPPHVSTGSGPKLRLSGSTRRTPTDNAPKTHVTKNTWHIPIDNEFHIIYQNASEEISERNIKIDSICDTGEKMYIYAYCSKRQKVVCFLGERIMGMSQNGTHITDPQAHLRQRLRKKPMSGDQLAEAALEEE